MKKLLLLTSCLLLTGCKVEETKSENGDTTTIEIKTYTDNNYIDLTKAKFNDVWYYKTKTYTEKTFEYYWGHTPTEEEMKETLLKVSMPNDEYLKYYVDSVEISKIWYADNSRNGMFVNFTITLYDILSYTFYDNLYYVKTKEHNCLEEQPIKYVAYNTVNPIYLEF